MSDEPAAEPGAPGAAPARPAPHEVRARMRRANTLVAERRLAEAEQEIVQALAGDPDDLRALKLLALVRFRLGRLDEAGEAYRRVTAAAPGDAAARLNLGLIALKLERFDEAAAELDTAVRLRPDDPRAASYLEYARGRLAPDPTAPAAAVPPPAALPVAQAAVPAPPPPAPPAAPATIDPRVTLTSFALDRLLIADDLAPASANGGDSSHSTDAAVSIWAAPDILRLPVAGEALAHSSTLLSASGTLAVTPARGRRRGRETEVILTSDGQPFYRCRGQGELWLAPPRRGASLAVVELEEDVLFLRRELVAAFTGDLVWDAGAVPCTRLSVLHFHGTGRLVVDWRGADVVALRLSEGQPLLLAEGRILGWIGRLVAQAAPGAGGAPAAAALAGAALVACEGEGVLLIARHGQVVESVHQRAEPGDDGAGHPHPLGPAVHR